jgi:subfamily B ATP-binding cassette protein MsbA
MIIQLKKYLNIFHRHFSKKVYLIFTLSALSGVFDVFAIVLIFPLFETLTENPSFVSGDRNANFITNWVLSLLEHSGIEIDIISILCAMGVLIAIKGCLHYYSLTIIAKFKGHFLADLRLSIIDRFSRIRYEYFIRRETGYFLNIINEQANRALSSFQSFCQLLSFLINVFIYFVAVFVVSFSFGVIAFIIGIILFAFFRILNRFVKRESLVLVEENSVFTSGLIVSFRSFKYLVSTGRESVLKNLVTNSIRRLSMATVNLGRAQAVTQSAREPVAIICLIIIVVIQSVLFGEPLTPIVVSVVLFYRCVNSLVQVQGYWQNVLEFGAGLEAIDQEIKTLDKHKSCDGVIHTDQIKESIIFSNVSFKYSGSVAAVLSGSNITISVGKSLAIVGASGSGKSTVIDLLTGVLVPSGGQVLVDGICLSNYKKSKYRKNFGFVMQSTVLFDDTIANNISLELGGRPSAEGLIEVTAAAKKASIHDFITSLPDGYGTLIGEDGVKLSGGQRQRLAIARELFKKPSVLILDEATSALDQVTEAEILQTFNDLRKEITLIFITHRIAAVRNFDKIIMLSEQGFQEVTDFDAFVKSLVGHRSADTRAE